jgi:hypothetical protein
MIMYVKSSICTNNFNATNVLLLCELNILARTFAGQENTISKRYVKMTKKEKLKKNNTI